jgi:putative membrane protein
MVLALLVAGGVARAQPAYDRPLKNSALKDTTKAQTKSDEEFAMQAAAGGMAQVKLSQLAMERAQAVEVKQFARRMLEDHTKANMQLKQIMDKQHLAMPQKLDGKQQQAYDKLAQLSGDDFDRQYMKIMTADHDATVVKFKNESLYGQDPEIKSFAMKTLPMLEEHSSMAHSDASKLKE